MEAYWTNGTRADGRLLRETRRITIQQGILTKNDAGSALVRQGSTVVLAAVSLKVGQPTTSADQGDVVVTLTAPAAEGNSNSGRMTRESPPQLQSFLQRCMEECLDLEQLTIVPGRSAFRLCVGVQVLNAAGNLMDACLTACTAALLDTNVPINPVIDSGKVWLPAKEDTEYKRLRMPTIPVSLTAGVWYKQHDGFDKKGNFQWIVDPDSAEESVLDSFLTVVVNAAEPNKAEVLSIDLSSITGSGIRMTEMALAVHMANGHASNLCKILVVPVGT
jgi:exosome complex RNA-binding protein Rrp42 (RNase PH superfamily)